MARDPAGGPLDLLNERHRLDKWLWAARFYKTRALAADDIGKGRAIVNGQPAKASRELHEGDLLDLRQHAQTRSFVVRSLSRQRGPATVAAEMYEETQESVARRLAAADARKSNAEPALAIEHGRPTKRDRRELADWDRWSASTEPD